MTSSLKCKKGTNQRRTHERANELFVSKNSICRKKEPSLSRTINLPSKNPKNPLEKNKNKKKKSKQKAPQQEKGTLANSDTDQKKRMQPKKNHHNHKFSNSGSRQGGRRPTPNQPSRVIATHEHEHDENDTLHTLYSAFPTLVSPATVKTINGAFEIILNRIRQNPAFLLEPAANGGTKNGLLLILVEGLFNRLIELFPEVYTGELVDDAPALQAQYPNEPRYKFTRQFHELMALRSNMDMGMLEYALMLENLHAYDHLVNPHQITLRGGPLRQAVRYDSVVGFRHLEGKAWDSNRPDEPTPLHCAVKYNSHRILHHLLYHSEVTNIPNMIRDMGPANRGVLLSSMKHSCEGVRHMFLVYFLKIKAATKEGDDPKDMMGHLAAFIEALPKEEPNPTYLVGEDPLSPIRDCQKMHGGLVAKVETARREIINGSELVHACHD